MDSGGAMADLTWRLLCAQLTAALQHLQQENAAWTAHVSAQLEQARADAERAAERAASAHAEELAVLREEAAANLLQVSSARENWMLKPPGCRHWDRHAQVRCGFAERLSLMRAAAGLASGMHLYAQPWQTACHT